MSFNVANADVYVYNEMEFTSNNDMEAVMVYTKGQAAEIKLESFLEKLEELYKEFDITCTEVGGVARMMHIYDGDSRIYVDAANGVLCLECGFIYQSYPDRKCPECLEKKTK